MRKNFQLVIIVAMTLVFGFLNQEANFSQKLVELIKQKLNEQKYQQIENSFKSKKQIAIDSCDLSQERLADVTVDIGFGDRLYYATTNANKQVVEVFARELILQDEESEPILANGRYCNDEANVFGTESKAFDQGHIIADSLGGVSNAYNITPEASGLNRSGMQRQMEQEIHDAIVDQKQVTNFHGQIIYPNTKTMIPSQYLFTFEINQQLESYQFNNE